MNSRSPTDWTAPERAARLKARYAAERRFRLLGLAAIALSALFLAFLLWSMTPSGIGGFKRTEFALPIDFPAMGLTIDQARLAAPDAAQALAGSGLQEAVGLAATQAYGPDGAALVSDSAWTDVRDALIADPSLLARKDNLVGSGIRRSGLRRARRRRSAMRTRHAQLVAKGTITNASTSAS